MDFRKFYSHCEFIPVREDPSENWDYYLMRGLNPETKPLVVALAKPGSGCRDCFYGDIAYYNRTMAQVVAQCGGLPFTPIDSAVLC